MMTNIAGSSIFVVRKRLSNNSDSSWSISLIHYLENLCRIFILTTSSFHSSVDDICRNRRFFCFCDRLSKDDVLARISPSLRSEFYKLCMDSIYFSFGGICLIFTCFYNWSASHGTRWVRYLESLEFRKENIIGSSHRVPACGSIEVLTKQSLLLGVHYSAII